MKTKHINQPDLFDQLLCTGCAGTGITWAPMQRYDPAGDPIQVQVGTATPCLKCHNTGIEVHQ